MTAVQPEAALRWVVEAHIDENVCKPCKDNDKKLYRNRQAAYRDYPNGKSYVKCVGAEFGNDCRCKVVKRGKASKNEGGDGAGTMNIGEIVNRYQVLTNRHGATDGSRDAGLPPRVVKPVDLRNSAESSGADLYLYDPIGGWGGIDPMDVVRALAEVSGPLTVHINSPGGSIFDGAAIYDALVSYGAGKGRVTSRIEGVAASAASFIALAAHEVETTDLGVMMIHDGMIAGFFQASQDDLLELADLVGMLSDNIAGVYARKTGGDPSEWRDIMRDGDNWYNAQAQVDARLADRIAGPSSPASDPKPDPEPEPEPEPEPDNSTTNDPAPIDYEGLRLALRGALLS